jgi:D-alanyl-D-alanine carboxypeptidase/D-alanyl-D-alanine-endopeptidase (penicillin-binding protein 4)
VNRFSAAEHCPETRARRGAPVLAAVLCAVFAVSCAARAPASGRPPRAGSSPATPGPAGPSSPAAAGATAEAPEGGASPTPVSLATTRLAWELRELFAAPALSTASVGGLVQSLDTGEVLFRLDADRLLLPASNLKIVTLAVAAARLGWDYRYETRLETTGPVEAGTLAGDLFVVGHGDPTIDGRGADGFSTFRQWAGELKAAGITHIAGRIVGDDDAFADEGLGAGWSWDDLVFAFAAPIQALQLNENAVDLIVQAGTSVGAPAVITLTPDASGLELGDVHVITLPPGSPADLLVRRLPGRRDLRITGGIAQDGADLVVRAAVTNPTAYFVEMLRRVLHAEGVTVAGAAVDVDEAPDADALKRSAGLRRVLVRHRSPPLSEIGKRLMKASQNLYAETLLLTLSSSPGPASVEASLAHIDETLVQWGLAPGQYVVADGSGLSRLNLLSAAAIVNILRAAARDAASFSAFQATFPVAGRDGTLSGRMKATRAEGNAEAKTGTLSHVRALSGFVRTADGQRLAFSFLVNNFTVPPAAVDAIVDQAVERLANFTR